MYLNPLNDFNNVIRNTNIGLFWNAYNLFTVSVLSKNAYPVAGLMSTHHLALEALLVVLESIERQCQRRISDRVPQPPLYQQNTGWFKNKKSEWKLYKKNRNRNQYWNKKCNDLINRALELDTFNPDRLISISSVDTFDTCLIRPFSLFLDITSLFQPMFSHWVRAKNFKISRVLIRCSGLHKRPSDWLNFKHFSGFKLKIKIKI